MRGAVTLPRLLKFCCGSRNVEIRHYDRFGRPVRWDDRAGLHVLKIIWHHRDGHDLLRTREIRLAEGRASATDQIRDLTGSPRLRRLRPPQHRIEGLADGREPSIGPSELRP
jgi:hypothetical protein